MALDIDGFAVFHSIASHREVFAGIAGDLAKSARTLVVKAIKDKSTLLGKLRGIRAALGGEAFNLIMDGVPDAQIKTVVSRLDKHNPELSGADAAWRHRHILALAEGAAEPVEKPMAAPKKQAPKKQKAKKAPERIHFESAGTVRKR